MNIRNLHRKMSLTYLENSMTLETTTKERALIDLIFWLHPVPIERRLDMEMSLIACHLNGCPLDLAAMARGRSADVYHDLHGIDYHINKETGKLKHFFIPRFAL